MMATEDAQKLRCNECNNYLSCSPIFLKQNGENVCGRCTVSEHEQFVVRNKSYETFASTMRFPCRYKMNGCNKKSPWAKVIYHEEACEYRPFKCLAGDCYWAGRYNDLNEHFEEVHEDLLLYQPCELKPDIVQDCDKYYLMSERDFLFVLHLKYVVSSSKLWYCVRLLEHSQFASYFYYILQITNNDSSNMTIKKLVQPEKSSALNNDTSIEMNINNLIEMGIIKNFDDATFTISVELRNNRCAECEVELTSFVKLTDEGCLCERCYIFE